MITFFIICAVVITLCAFGEVAVNDYRDMKEEEKDYDHE